MRQKPLLYPVMALLLIWPGGITALQEKPPLSRYQLEYPIRTDSPNAQPTHRIFISLNRDVSMAGFFSPVNGRYFTQQWHLLSQHPLPVSFLADIGGSDKAALLKEINELDIVAEATDAGDLPEARLMGECGWREAFNVAPFDLLARNIRQGMTPLEVKYILGEHYKKRQEDTEWCYEFSVGLHYRVVLTVKFTKGKVESCDLEGKSFYPGNEPSRTVKKEKPDPEKIPSGFKSKGWKTFFCGGKRNKVEIYLHDKTGLEFVLIPGGTFTLMSSADSPGREVTIRPFLICRTECTQKAWDLTGGYDIRQWKNPDLPIERVDWNGCREWCAKTGLRLPTESEWEYACRGGTKTSHYFGKSSSGLEKYAWYNRNSQGKTHPVGRKKPNAFGLFDLFGNISEWCEDSWREDYSKTPVDGTAWVDPETLNRCVRGGCWECATCWCSSARRRGYRLGLNDMNIGFRPACSMQK